MIPKVEMVVLGLISQGYFDYGGSDVFRILRHKITNQCIKVFYDNYDNPNHIIIGESIEGYNEKNFIGQTKWQ